jgi:hypothetical protein
MILAYSVNGGKYTKKAPKAQNFRQPFFAPPYFNKGHGMSIDGTSLKRVYPSGELIHAMHNQKPVIPYLNHLSQ